VDDPDFLVGCLVHDSTWDSETGFRETADTRKWESPAIDMQDPRASIEEGAHTVLRTVMCWTARWGRGRLGAQQCDAANGADNQQHRGRDREDCGAAVCSVTRLLADGCNVESGNLLR
jgi:hypothetical protein